MASVAVGISCMGPLGEKQGYLPYSSGLSQQALAFPIGHFEFMGSLIPPRYMK
jgi:hypothetical protein